MEGENDSFGWVLVLGRKSLISGRSLYSESTTWPCGRPLTKSLFLRILIDCFGIPSCVRSHLCFSRMASCLRWVGVISGLMTVWWGILDLFDRILETSVDLTNWTRIGRGERASSLYFPNLIQFLICTTMVLSIVYHSSRDVSMCTYPYDVYISVAYIYILCLPSCIYDNGIIDCLSLVAQSSVAIDRTQNSSRRLTVPATKQQWLCFLVTKRRRLNGSD